MPATTVRIRGKVDGAMASLPRKRRVLLAVLLGLLLIGAAGGATLAYYSTTYEEAEEICQDAEVARTLAERERILARAAGARARIAFFQERVWSCHYVETDLAELRTSGKCPEIPLDDVPCRCGEQRWPEQWRSPQMARCALGHMPPRLMSADAYRVGRRARLAR